MKGWPRALWAGVVVAGLVVAAVAGAAWQGRTETVKGGGPVLAAVDIGFAQDMSVHHDQAVLMVDSLPATASPAVRTMAQQIREGQLREVGTLRGWLSLYELPMASRTPMTWMHDHEQPSAGASPMADMAGMPAMTVMPGMASAAEINRLRTLTGTEADRLFLQLMVRHHQGGIAMASYAAKTSAVPDVQRTAQAMFSEQTNEVLAMVQLLRADGGQPLPYP